MTSSIEQPRRTPLLDSLAGRSPRRGCGRLFAGFRPVSPGCSACGLDLGGQDSGDGPVTSIVLVVGAVVVAAALLVEIGYGWPVWLPLSMTLCLGMTRPLKGALIGPHHRHRWHEIDAGA